MASIYIETSIASYLRLRPSAHIVTAARQLITQRWWQNQKKHYDLYTSQFVLDEASQGDSHLAAERLDALEGIPLLDLPDEVYEIAEELLSRAILPNKARLDSLHISVAAFHGVEYLLTWNCTHIANARLIPRINELLTQLSYNAPYICTPDELLDDETDYNS